MRYLGFFDQVFWQSLVSEIIATFIGALLGILTALWLDRRLQAKRIENENKKQQELFKNEKVKILNFIKIEILKNIDLLEMIKENLKPDKLIFNNLDLSAWTSLESKKAEYIDNLDLLIKLSQLYYDYQLISRRIDLDIQSACSAFRAVQGYAQFREQLVSKLITNIQPALEKSNYLIKIIDEELEVIL